MKKVILITLLISFLFIPSMVGAGTYGLSRKISNCICAGNSNAFKRGCDFYIDNRLKGISQPDQAATSAKQRCDTYYNEIAQKEANSKCKEGVTFFRNI